MLHALLTALCKLPVFIHWVFGNLEAVVLGRKIPPPSVVRLPNPGVRDVARHMDMDVYVANGGKRDGRFGDRAMVERDVKSIDFVLVVRVAYPSATEEANLVGAVGRLDNMLEWELLFDLETLPRREFKKWQS